ncbi:SsrA-binding protein [Candidatus Woesebacteria bacterium RIFCSPHIGHO2_01_FULL_38_9b]|uniref:SsrA-binding protein n=1 Tax=Candidatus Woesebacteria bacterium RIFCSPHIGHO2_01_FULL_38_9b TaxID=1802493 RepID=A0A1F7Y408_9BACT|nr:MAG: SsrA-binding protein [Candidatus Woesebacteria bacterium RIFCSPHIGHO2_01_FULL_38_9b]
MQVLNRKAKFNYFLYERLEAGISLLGGEAKAVRGGKVDLSQSYVKLIDNQAFLVNANIPIEGKKDYESTRSRKLLLHKDQIVSLKTKIKTKRLTVVPVRMYNKGRLLKVEIALAKSKRKFEKKEAIKRKDIEREIEEEFKNLV